MHGTGVMLREVRAGIRRSTDRGKDVMTRSESVGLFGKDTLRYSGAP